MTADIVFVDTETLGLHPDAPIWEFAAVRRRGDFVLDQVEFFIHHDPEGWLEDFPEQFAADYHARFDETTAVCPRAAAGMIHQITRGANLVGAVPSFDTERIAKLLRRNGIEPEWHYHIKDVEDVVSGYLAALRRLHPDPAERDRLKELIAPPYLSNDLSRAVGVDPDQYARHTAMGDVSWAMAQWDAVMGR